MSTTPQMPLENLSQHELHPLREHWLLLLLLGVGLTVVGTAAIISSFIATLATVIFFGTMLFLGGILEVVVAVTCRNWRGFVTHLLAGVLYGVVGMVMMNHVGVAVLTITLMIAAAFMIGGILRIVLAATERFSGWPWVMLNGFITLILGMYIWRHFPGDAFWVIGLLVGIDLIFCGWSWIILALGIRSAFPNKAGT